MSIVEKRKGGAEKSVDERGQRPLHQLCRARLIALVAVVVTVAVASLSGCESDTARYARLRQDMLTACLAVDPPISTYTPSEQQRAACAVAERKYNRFMGGR